MFVEIIEIIFSEHYKFNADPHMIFKAHVGMSMAVSLVGALCMIQLVLSFLGVLACADCGEGKRIVGFCAFVFSMIGNNLC